MKIRKISSILYFLFLSWLLPFTGFQAHAATYYIDPSGLNSNLGTQSQPWLTLQYAASRAVAGDTVLVNNGTYSGFYSVNSGSSSNPITFSANGSNVVINSRNANTPDNINIEGNDYIIVDGFIVQNSPRGGIRVAEATGVIVRNNTVGPCGLWCVFTAFAPEVQILNNKVFGSTNEIALYVSNSRTANDNPVIRGNEVYGSSSSGIQVNGDCFSGGDGVISGAIIENNIVHDNNAKGFSLTSMTNSVVQNNISYNNGTGNRGAGGIHLSDQVSPSPCGTPSNNNVVMNNTIVEPRIAGIRITDGAVNNVIFNNLVVATETIVDEVGNNNIDTTSNITRSSTTGLFVNPLAGDYHLSSNSPAIDAGRASYSGSNAPSSDFEGTNRPQGSAFDAGYDEFGAGSGNAFPTVTLSSNNTSGNFPLTINFTANASDSDGTITQYEWDLDGNGVYEATTTSNTSSYTYNNIGTYNPRVRVTDNGGATATSSIVTITVSSSSGGGGTQNTSSSGSTDVSGGGCGFVKDDNSGRGSNGHDVRSSDTGLIMMLVIVLGGIALLKKRSGVMKKTKRIFLISFTILLILSSFSSYASAAIEPTHPRLILTSSKLAELRAKACYDASGNVISNCTPQASWTRVKNWADTYLNSNSSTIDPACSSTQPAYTCWQQYQARNFAIVYQITRDTRYADEAVKVMDYWYANYDITQGGDYRQHYDARSAGLTMGLAYDWIYDRLDATRRTNYIAKMNQWMFNFTNPYGTLGSTSATTVFRDGPDYDYYNGYLVGAAAMAYATYGDNADSQSYIDFVKTRVSTEVIPFLEGQPYTRPLSDGYPIKKGVGLGSGGIWSSGWQYGDESTKSILYVLGMIKSAEGIDYFNTEPVSTVGLNFLKEMPIAMVYSTMPDLRMIYHSGRMARDPINQIVPYYRTWMAYMADEFKATQPAISRRIQYWLNNNNMQTYMLQGLSWAVAMTEEFLWYNSTLPQENYNTINPIYYAPGTQILLGRSGWGANDTWFTFKSGGRWTLNNDNSQNHFDIFKYTSLADDSWSFPPYSGRGVYGQASAHNIIINNLGSDELESVYWQGEATIPRREDTTNYSYIVGDATDVYVSQPGSGVTFNEREFLYIKDIDHFVIFDRYNTDGTPSQIWWLLHSYYQPTIVSSDTGRIDNGSGRLFVKTLLPQNPIIAGNAQTTTSSARLQVSPSVLQTNNQFLHVLYPTSTSTAAMTDTVRVSSSSGNMVGAHIQSTSENNIVMFSSSAIGAAVSGDVSYTFYPTTTNTRHYLFGMQANTLYYISANSGASGTAVNISINSGTTQVASSSQGTLSFVLNGLTVVPPPSDTTPPSVPTGLSAQAVSSSQINLSWSASTDNVGVAGYRIYRDGAQIDTTTTTSYSNTGLSASTTYIYAVSAYDAANNVSAQSASASATTASDTGGNTGGSGGDTSASGGSGCGFVKSDGKGQGAKGEGVALMIMLVIALAGMAIGRRLSYKFSCNL